MSFQVSDKVVCVLPSGAPNNTIDYTHATGYPEVGKVYVVREVLLDGHDNVCLLLVGMCAGHWPAWDGREAGFMASRFRKLSEVQQENAYKRAGFVKVPLKNGYFWTKADLLPDDRHFRDIE